MKQILLFLSLLLPFCASSQFIESFSGPVVTSNNPWEGDPDKFIINSSEQLQFTSPKNRSGNANLYVPVFLGENMTWEIDVKLDFKSTNFNNLKIYVYYSDDLKIYVQVGSNNGQVSLYRQYGGNSPIPIIAGQKGLLSTEPYDFISIRLTLEDSYVWTLYTCRADEEFYKEGSLEEYYGELSGMNRLMLSFVYIQSRISTYYVDNIQITSDGNIQNDISEVELIDIKQVSAYELQFIFDHPVNISGAECIIDDIGKAERITYGKDQSIVNIRLPDPLEEEKEYLLTWKGLLDMEGKRIEEFSLEIYFEDDGENPLPTTHEKGQVIINEVMANPKGLTELPETEYVELYNTSELPVSLNSWTFIYNDKETLLDNMELPAGGYVVLYRAGRDIHVDEGGLIMPLSKFPAALADGGKDLKLKDAAGTLIDDIVYPKAERGKSFERFEDDWYISTDKRGGTPGSVNSEPEGIDEPGKPVEPGNPEEPSNPEDPDISDVETGEVVFNELLPNPFAGGSEYIELYNRSNRSLSFKGLAIAIRKADGTLSTQYPLSGINSILEKDDYVLLTKNKQGVEDWYSIHSPNVLYELKLPVLANTSSTIVLFRIEDKIVIDEVSYSSKWHVSSVKDQKGVALERIDPDGNSQDPENWTSATALCGYGTPGYKNSQYAKKDSEGGMHIDAPVRSEDGFYSVKYHLNSSGYFCRAYIYNMNGYKVAEIANNELLGQFGELRWNGKSLDGNRLITGVYIFYMELFNTKGDQKHLKKVFLIR